MKNKQGVSVHAGGAFYDHKPVSLQIYVEYGGVCGAVSKGAAGFVKAKGNSFLHDRPAGALRFCVEGNGWRMENRE